MAEPILLAPRWLSIYPGDFLEPDPVLEQHTDFTRYDAYLDTLPLVYHRGEAARHITVIMPAEPDRIDIGQSRFEVRADFGNSFSQGDFSGGTGQEFYHRPLRNEAAYYRSEGFDISKPGRLSHLNRALEEGNFAGVSSFVQAEGVLFFANGARVTRGGSSFPATYIDENPHAGEPDTTVSSLTSQGLRLYAALGPNGVHVRAPGGGWGHFKPDGTTNLQIGSATCVAWAKDRLFAVGQGGRAIYAIGTISSPAALETLPEGWSFEGIWEAGPFVLAAATNPASGQSRVHAYGPDESGSIVKRNSTPMPRGDLIRCGTSYLGRTFVGGGRVNVLGGYDPVVYEAEVLENGSLELSLVASVDRPANGDLSVRSFETLSGAVVFPWSTVERRGLGIYHLGRNAFAPHLLAPYLVGGPITDVLLIAGRLVFGGAEGLFVEQPGRPVPEAWLTTSIADWNSASVKTWDLFQVQHDPLPHGGLISLEYTTRHPDEGGWLPGLISDVVGSRGTDGRIKGTLKSRFLAARIVSETTAEMTAPVFRSFTIRSVSSPEEPEWLIIRTIRVTAGDRRDRYAEPAAGADPRSMIRTIRRLAHTWVTLYEPDQIYVGYVISVRVEPIAAPRYSETLGTPEEEGAIIEIQLVAREAGREG